MGSPVTALPALGAGLYTVYPGLARPGTLDRLYLAQAPFLVVRGGNEGVRLGSLRLYTFNTAGYGGVGTYSDVGGRFIRSDGTLDATRRVLDGIEPMRWRGNRGIGEVVVRAHAENHTLHCSVDCRFVDDGEGEIPAFLLQKLWNCGRQSYQAVGGSLTVSRQRYRFFDTLRNELDYGVVLIRSADQLTGYWLGDQ